VLDGRFSYSSERTWFTRFGEWFWYASMAAAALLLALPKFRGGVAAGPETEPDAGRR
jgi:hypothetical protein